MFWHDDVVVDWIEASSQALHGVFTKENRKMVVSFIYTKCKVVEKREFWQELENFRISGLPWIIARGFNIIRQDSECTVGHPRSLEKGNYHGVRFIKSQ